MSVDVPAFLLPLTHIAAPPPASDHWLEARIAGSPNPLIFDMQPQSLDNWCWAATAASIQAFYFGAAAQSQCQVATAVIHQQCCPPGPNDSTNPNNIEWALQDALQSNLAAPDMTNQAADFDLVQSEIDRGRPLCCGIAWNGSGGHFTIIIGYIANQEQDLLVVDPQYADPTNPTGFSVPYQIFKTSYFNRGVWHDTYLTQP